jgi:hypothetical protein
VSARIARTTEPQPIRALRTTCDRCGELAEVVTVNEAHAIRWCTTCRALPPAPRALEQQVAHVAG